MLVTSLATAGTVFTLNIYKSGDKEVPVPMIIQKIFFDVIAKILLINVKRSKSLKLMMHEYAIKKQKQNQDVLKSYYKKTVNNQFLKEQDCAKQLNTNEEYIQMTSQQNGHSVGDTLSNKILLKASPLIMPVRTSADRHSYKLNLSNTSLNSTINDSALVSTLSKQMHPMNVYPFKPLINSNFNHEFKKFGSGKIHRSTKKTKLERNFTISTGESYPFVNNNGNKPCDEHKHLVKLIKNLSENLETKEIKGIMQESKQDIRNQWIQLAKVIDTLMFYLFFISTCLIFYFLVQELPNAKFS
jgi:hypothetical protein